MIKRRILGRTGLEVSEIGFGALEIGRDWAADVNSDPSHPTDKEAERILNGILDLGINFIDTAPAYWNSEEFIGRALSRRRGEFILATKVGERCDRSGSEYDYSGPAVARFIENSLKKLRTDHIDLIQIHSARMEVLERGETYLAMEKARQEGKARFIGMTGGAPECLKAVELGCFDTIQVPYSLLNLASEDGLLEKARENNVGVIIMRGLAGGKLTEKFERLENEALREAIRGLLQFTGPGKEASSLAHLALGYVLAHPAVCTVIAGTRRLEAVRANIAAAAMPLHSDFVEEVRRHVAGLGIKAW